LTSPLRQDCHSFLFIFIRGIPPARGWFSPHKFSSSHAAAFDRLRLEEDQQIGVDPMTPLPPITTIFIVDASHICFS